MVGNEIPNHSVHYRGRLSADGLEIEGQWWIDARPEQAVRRTEGAFRLRRQPAGRAEAERASAIQTTPAPPESRLTEEAPGDVPLAPARPVGRKVPRVWTVFVAFLVALVGSVLVQVLVVILLFVVLVARGADVQQVARDLQRLVMTPAAFILLGLSAQLVIGLAALLPARWSPEPTRSRLGLVRADLPAWGYLAVAVGSLAPLAAGVALAVGVTRLVPADQSVAQLYQEMTWAAAVPFVLFVALAPAFVEELLFRGYIQRRLLQRWSPWVAIGVSSLLFTVMHITPQAMAGVLPLAVWLGVLAWRTGSVWPGIACHACVNSSWNVLNVGARLGAWPDLTDLSPSVLAAGGTLVLACFLAGAWLVTRPRAGRKDPGPGTKEGEVKP
jgi:membrane protease YdiL (CAAX protease family)